MSQSPIDFHRGTTNSYHPAITANQQELPQPSSYFHLLASTNHTQLLLYPRISPFFQTYINTTQRGSSKNSAMVAQFKQPYPQPLFRKLFLAIQKAHATKTSFKNKAIRNLSCHNNYQLKLQYSY